MSPELIFMTGLEYMVYRLVYNQNFVIISNSNIKSRGSQKFKWVTDIAKKGDLVIQDKYFLS